MDWLTTTPIAHRGLHDEETPENSLAAFQAAIDAGYAIECDVQCTADGVPVVFHDRELARLTRADGRVEDTSWSALQELELAGTTHQIPRLQSVLERVDGRMALLVEIKNRSMSVGHIERRVVDELDAYDGPFAVQSFNPRSLAYFRKIRPAWPRGQLAARELDDGSVSRIQQAVLERLLATPWSRPDFVAYRHTDLPYWPVTLHRRAGLPVLAWTVRSREAAEAVASHAENVIFEGYRPSLR